MKTVPKNGDLCQSLQKDCGVIFHPALAQGFGRFPCLQLHLHKQKDSLTQADLLDHYYVGLFKHLLSLLSGCPTQWFEAGAGISYTTPVKSMCCQIQVVQSCSLHTACCSGSWKHHSHSTRNSPYSLCWPWWGWRLSTWTPRRNNHSLYFTLLYLQSTSVPNDI